MHQLFYVLLLSSWLNALSLPPLLFYVAVHRKMIDGVSPARCQRLEWINGQETPACSPSCVCLKEGSYFNRNYILLPWIPPIRNWRMWFISEIERCQPQRASLLLGTTACCLTNSTRPEAWFSQAAVLLCDVDLCHQLTFKPLCM